MSAPRVVAVLAQGGSGRVELAFRAEGAFRRMYAVKRLRQGLAEDARVREYFLREAAITTRLRHPNVVSVLDVGTDERGLYLVMDHVLGVSLRELREALGARRMPAQLVWQLGCAVARALHAVHGLADEDGTPLGLVHRDVTPGNVMVGYDGIARLLDFGLARASDERTASLLQGTSGYLAPEQLRFETVDGRADLFALGVVLHELLHGARLYGDADVRVAARRTLDEPLGVLDASLDPAEEELLRSLLAKIPAARPTSARETARRLEGLWRARVRREGAQDVRRFLATVLEGREGRARTRLAALWRAFEATSARGTEQAAPPRAPSRAWLALGVLVLAAGLGWVVWTRAGTPAETSTSAAAAHGGEPGADGSEVALEAPAPSTVGSTAQSTTAQSTTTQSTTTQSTTAQSTTELTAADGVSGSDPTPDATSDPAAPAAEVEEPAESPPRRRPPRRRPRTGEAPAKNAGLWGW